MTAVPAADDLARFLCLEEERRELERQARLREKAVESIKADLFSYCAAQGDRCELHGHALAIETSRGQPNWKELYVRDVGLVAAERALADAAPRRRLTVLATA